MGSFVLPQYICVNLYTRAYAPRTPLLPIPQTLNTLKTIFNLIATASCLLNVFVLCGASHRRHCTLLPLRGGTATQALHLSVLRTLTSLNDMLLLSLCARAHSATCSPGTCDLWPLILVHSYLSTTHSLHSRRSAFCVLTGYVPGFWFQYHNESTGG